MRRDLPMILIRVVVGLVFLTEGILKFVHPEQLGAASFAGIGLPFPHLLAPLVGGIEIAGGAAILLNFYAGDAALMLLVVIIAALVTTKVPILLGRQFGPLSPRSPNRPVHALWLPRRGHRLRPAHWAQETLVSIQGALGNGRTCRRINRSAPTPPAAPERARRPAGRRR